MELTFIGTGTSQGVPVITCKCKVCSSVDQKDKRLRTAAFISSDRGNVVIDTGPDFRQQMLMNQFDQLDAVVFTHEHKDHIAGLDDIRAYNFKQKKAMEVFASDRVEEALRREYHYVFAEKKYPGIPQFNVNRIDSEPFEAANILFQPIRVLHHQLPVLGFRVGNLTYITDANYIHPSEKEKIKGSKILILNALRKEKHISHFNLEEAIELARELEVEQTYFTHISHLMGRHSDIQKELPENMFLAYDGLTIKFDA